MIMTPIQRENRAAARNWGKGNLNGRDAADELISQMKKVEAPTLLGHTAKGFIEAGTFGAYEVGFFHRIAERLMFNL